MRSLATTPLYTATRLDRDRCGRRQFTSMRGLLAIVVIGVAIATANHVHWAVGVAVFIGGLACLAEPSSKQRLASLTARFGAEAAAHIMRKDIWQGATPEMIMQSIGQPVDIDEQVLKTKTKRTFKYCQTGKNKFALRVMFEDGVCVGWDDKR